MAMGARFESPLERQQDGALEVCGPVRFGVDGMMFELLRFEITDNTGRRVEIVCNPPVRARHGEMWESRIPPPKARRLAKGQGASGKGRGRMHTRVGKSVPIRWKSTDLEIE